MKHLILPFLLLLFLSGFTNAQDTRVKSLNPGNSGYEIDWGNDILVHNFEPLGKLTGAAKSSGLIYLAIPDTSSIPNTCISVYKSTNYGNSWSLYDTLGPSAVVSRMKMVRSGLDSIYLFYILNDNVFCWNLENALVKPFTAYTGIRDFDAEASSTGSIYLAIDLIANNQIRFFGSADGGTTWPNTIYLSSTGARLRWYMSPGDTLAINYYSPVLSDTAASVIRNVRYRQSAPATLTIVGSFGNLETSSAQRTEFQSVFVNGVIWFFYTYGTTGAIDIKCMVSTNSGGSYGTAYNVAGNPNTDEYWLEARHFTTGVTGVDLIYYSDSLQSGTPNNSTDKMMYCFSNSTTPNTFSGLTQFSEHPPGWSARGYVPAVVEMYNTSDVGAVWVGLDGTNKRVWWDRYLGPVSIRYNEGDIPLTYILMQNYPNPFNPVTKIEFALPREEFVTLKVYDVLGRVVRELVSKDMKAGEYKIDFDASALGSGIYFYTLKAGSFMETRKMILLK